MPKIEMEALADQLVSGGAGRASGPRGVEGKEGYTPGTTFFVKTEDEANALVSRQLAKRLSLPAEELAAAEAKPSEPPSPDPERWLLQVTPDVYLERWPTGEHAAQAAAIIAARQPATPTEDRTPKTPPKVKDS